ncbi:2-isopropylmalate synthase [Palleronia sp. LCG004]|uniref:2-isopropylmalate synthase n=1 Tax=Palleronia sp. LCG004 TaxID=3079304 RepID=UPI002942FA7F|nr:2-isopropylmalate synthase [Palleronia sp. LCG004]WOI56257.1 2-isopropylmalate synthase [Palleronia sp. LCG004]
MTNQDLQKADDGRVLIFDTTLRDGEQSPGATMSHREKLELAEMLDEMGVDIIEAGFPIASEGDFAAVKAIAERTKRATICGLARANIKDIDRAWEAVKPAASPRIHTFIGTSPLHRAIPNLDQDQMAERIHETVTHARNLCDNVQWSPMDATRTEWDFLKRTVEIAIKAGATTINIPDTVGYTAPVESADLIRRLIAEVEGGEDVIFATHCHNDLGMATANSLAAVAGGARQIECTINGLGERAGNTALEEVVMALKVRNDIMPWSTGVDSTRLMAISRRVSTISGFPVQFNKAIVGKNAFAHESGIHQDGMLKNAETFEIMRPADVGLKETSLVMGKHSGRAALRSKLKELGFDVADNQLGDIFVRFKELADRKKEVYDEDIEALVRAQGAGEEAVQLKFLRVICGTEAPQSADMTLRIDGEDRQVTAQGDGPVDAAFNAVKSLVPHEAQLQLYQVHAVTEGTDAQATVTVRMEEDGRIVTGQSADTDTVVASARAYIAALNRLLVKRRTTEAGSDTKAVSYKDAG